jgi:hypothetical protein
VRIRMAWYACAGDELNMATRSKVAGRLKRSEATVAEVPTEPPKPAADQPRSIATPAPAGGRGGKRSDPAYSPTTFFVRKETKKKATRILLDDAHAGKDLSDLVEELLSEWVSKQANVV